MTEQFDVIIVAAGSGDRFKSETPKQLLPLKGIPLYLWSVRAFSKLGQVQRIIVATQKELVSQLTNQIQQDEVLKSSGKIFEVLEGGKTRQESVLKALQGLRKLASGWIGNTTIDTRNDTKKELPTGSVYVMIHDGARPLVTQQVILGVWEKRGEGDGVVPGVLPTDTVKIIKARSTVDQTLDRSSLRLIQTPQLFKTSVIADLHQRAIAEVGGEGGAFDDAVLAEQMGLKVVVAEGDSQNIKVTYPGDFDLVSYWARDRHP